MIASIIAHLLALALAASAPQCSHVNAVTPLHGGQYAAVTCPEATHTVSVRSVPPRIGPARVVRRGSVYSLAQGARRWGIVR
jgi:hypothetical protein